MPNSTRYSPWSRDANQLARPPVVEWERCEWFGCHHDRYVHLPLCFDHASFIHGQMASLQRDKLAELSKIAYPPALEPPDEPQRLVYYLILSPTSVKIGTTGNLKLRLSQLRTDLQYVVAVEWGGRELERQRHLEFATERYGLREDFLLSDRLKAHIESLHPKRDEIIALAAQPGGYRGGSDKAR
jgi:hypothetical protein